MPSTGSNSPSRHDRLLVTSRRPSLEAEFAGIENAGRIDDRLELLQSINGSRVPVHDPSCCLAERPREECPGVHEWLDCAGGEISHNASLGRIVWVVEEVELDVAVGALNDRLQVDAH